MTLFDIEITTPDGLRNLGGDSGPWPREQAERIAARLTEQAKRSGWRLSYRVVAVE